MKRCFAGISLLVLIILFSADTAMANGNIHFYFRYKDANGVDTPLLYAFAYLQDGTKDPPMEKFFRHPLYILWGSLGSIGEYSVSVPAGTYYLRITQRNPTLIQSEGPPRPGDYSWKHSAPITVRDNITTDLGTIYAGLFGHQITVQGNLVNTSGVPLAGRYVRAQSTPCYNDGRSGNINQCGPDKYPALQQTDAAGNYTIYLMSPGTYYLYISECLGSSWDYYTGNPCMGYQGGIITVKTGENKNFNMIGY